MLYFLVSFVFLDIIRVPSKCKQSKISVTLVEHEIGAPIVNLSDHNVTISIDVHHHDIQNTYLSMVSCMQNDFFFEYAMPMPTILIFYALEFQLCAVIFCRHPNGMYIKSEQE